jgi:uncharacterized repeat protein (TIGR04052 family)
MKRLSAFVIPFALSACAVTPSHQSGTQPVEIRFVAQINGQAFECGKSYSGVGTTKSTITPSDFRLYVSQVELLSTDGKAVPVALNQDKTWQLENIALLDFENGQGPCRNGTPATNISVRGSVPVGNYSGLKFTVGVPFARNHGDPTVSPAPLSSTAMFWNWQGGYKFIKFDAATSGQPAVTVPPAAHGGGNASGFSVHLGSTVCASASKTQAPSGCQNSNRMDIRLSDFNAASNVVVIDMGRVLANSNVDINTAGTSPGCMSFPKDADCPAVMSALGLAYDGVPAASSQRLISKQ